MVFREVGLGFGDGLPRHSEVERTVGRWPFPVRCFHQTSRFIANSFRCSTRAASFASSSKTRSFARGSGFRWPRPQVHKLPLLWFLQRSPLHRHRLIASTPGCPGLEACQLLKRVPSLSFLPTSTVYSAMDPAGLLHPAADPGVHLVSSRATDIRRRSTFLTDEQPFEVCSFSEAVSLSPGFLPSRRWCLGLTPLHLDLKDLFNRKVRSVPQVLPPVFSAGTPMGFSRFLAFATLRPKSQRSCRRTCKSPTPRRMRAGATTFPQERLRVLQWLPERRPDLCGRATQGRPPEGGVGPEGPPLPFQKRSSPGRAVETATSHSCECAPESSHRSAGRNQTMSRRGESSFLARSKITLGELCRYDSAAFRLNLAAQDNSQAH